MAGTLYLVASPIGNMGDLTARAGAVLAQVDLVAAEDTRRSGQLLQYLGIKKPLTSYFEHNKRKKGEVILNALLDGQNVALLCDAGTPGIADPGADIAREAIAAGIDVIPIPGACAMLTALMASGLTTERFVFEGFLPRKEKERKLRLEELQTEMRTMVFYEAPHRLKDTLKAMEQVFGQERKAVCARELTKKFEEFLRMDLAQLNAHFAQKDPKGEFVVVVAGAEKRKDEIEIDLHALLEVREQLEQEGLSRKEAAKAVAKLYGKSVKEIYGLGLEQDEWSEYPCD